MGHIEDRWYKTIAQPDGTTVKVRTDLYGKWMRYRVRYLDPDGRERKKSFPDRAKKKAEDFLVTVEADKLRGTYLDPAAGRITFKEYAEGWLRTRVLDESSREGVEIRVRRHLYPYFASRHLASIKPGHIREWDASMVGVIAPSTRAVTFTHLRTILGAAVDDERIAKNPCSARSVTPPRPIERKVIPWTLEQITAIRAGLPPRYRPLLDLGSGCGMRQGEILGFSVDDLNFDTGWIHIRRQVKRVRSRLVFGLPKNDKDRRVPLPDSVAERLHAHIEHHPPVEVTLPWESPSNAERVTARLMFTTTRRNAIDRSWLNEHCWVPALLSAGIEQSRATGMHALRHFYASALLDAGESIKALAAYLGHSDPGFTLRVYTHLMPASEDRTRKAIDHLFRLPDDE
ncbi:tyrosine-type recombinase/integrase [Jidongwangia harbinensis]|uniref:tyrosine-type recombinase/integrase n=1 Tax=Jidongwangia harbinensis TaxID=2878561 RepID=UPI001CDA428D|nr:site-specific integrase [Jidongwangia harbinensis]MCA2212564.1 site-specific integrase [Jidongwangia harbinensis]